MPLFTSSREKHLWVWAFLVFVSIFSTLFIGRPLARLLGNQDVQAVIFLMAMLLIGAAILVHSLQAKPSKIEAVTWLGIAAVYTMFFLRLGMAERSHLIEYSVLAIFVHKAIAERKDQGRQIQRPALLSLVITFLIGLLDECIQLFLPHRVFDPWDILFNGIAVTMAIGSRVVLSRVRLHMGKSKWKRKRKN